MCQSIASEPAFSPIELLCATKGLRMTGHRRIVVRVLCAAQDHPSVEELHRRACAIDSRISLSTVYRTVRLLEQQGVLERHDFGAGCARYEPARDSHHGHLVDVATGRIIEFQNGEIERLQKLIAHELGFELVGHKLELYGVAQASRDRTGELG